MASKKPIAIEADSIYAYYLGDGTAFISGAPIRDLSRAEWDILDDYTRDLCLATELYKLASAEPAEEVTDGR